ncbi:hypothetical protein ACHAPJ_010666 [Fusarium lateritium]
MLNQYCKHKMLIRKTFYEEEFDKRMFQDALAIIHFPPQDIPQPDRNQIWSHITQWSAGLLPCPFECNNRAALERLDKLYDRLTTFIEDYITKATSAYPPRAYLGLPDLSSKRGQLQFGGKPIGFEVIKVDSLSHRERQRLFQAFLRHEVLCKVQHLQRGREAPRKLDKLITTAYGNLRNWEGEAIRSVHEYIKDLYGAVFAHCADSWLPELPPKLLTETDEEIVDDGLCYPDNVLFLPYAYYNDTITRPTPLSYDYLEDLALCGFDLITRLLTLPRDKIGRPKQLESWLQATNQRYQNNGRSMGFVMTQLLDIEILEGPNSQNWEQAGGNYRVLHAGIPTSWIHLSLKDMHFYRLQMHVYRQRAWVFFDDARYYPGQNLSLQFPTFEQLLIQGGRHELGDIRNVINAAIRRKAKKSRDQCMDRYVPDVQMTRSDRYEKFEFETDEEYLTPFYMQS